MSKEQNEQKELRASVESQLARAQPENAPVAPPGDLHHELQVHEIELEMQNEALRQSGVMLEESRDRYVDFYDFAPVGYLTLSHKALIAEINLTGAAMLGEVRSKLLRRRFSEFLAPECHDRWYRHFMDVQQHEGKLTCELDITRRDGQFLHVQLDSLRLVKDGLLPVVRIALTDITELKRAETALRDSENRQRVLEQQKLIQTSLDGFWVAQAKDERILEANNAFCGMVGYSREELLTMRIPDLEAVDAPEETAAHIKEVMEVGYGRFETRLRHKQGHLVDLEASGSYSAMNSGEFYVFARDITERKRAERYEKFRSQTLELLSGNTSLQEVLEGIVLGVEQLNPGIICTIMLLDRGGKRFHKSIGPSLPDFYNEGIEGVEIGIGVGSCGTAAATGERVIVEDIMTHPYWTPYKGLAAKAGLAACWSEPIRSSTGKVLGTFAVYHREVCSPAEFDISVIEKSTHLVCIAIERKRAEEALLASELEFRTLTENLPDILVRYDREGRRIYVNPVLERSFSIKAEQMLGKSLRENNPVNLPMPETYLRALEHTLATGERSEFEMQITPPDDNMRTGLCFIVAERAADGHISGAISVTRDITELKRSKAELERHRNHLERLVEERTFALSIAKETAEAATRAKSHFLAAASHDLRQPLQAIGLFNEALAMTALDEKQKRLSRNLSKSVDSLSELLNELLDLSRLDAGMIEPKPTVIQADDLLGMIEAEFTASFRGKNLSFRSHYPRDSLAIFCDDNLLLTLLRNLVSNAVKYTSRGGVLVGVRRRKDHALIQVWDTGIGIAPEQADSIFEEYFQVDNPQRDRAKGVGLGLAIVKRLSKLLGIEVRLRSRLGKGSLFELYVPLANESDVQAQAIPASTTPQTVASARFSGKRIVVVEDDAIVADAIKFSLEIAGAHVTHFSTAEDVLGSAEAMAADHYISDFRLPGMNGLQLLNAIQTRSAVPIKAVLLTGNTSPEQMAITQSSHWKVLIKPVNLPKLLSAME